MSEILSIVKIYLTTVENDGIQTPLRVSAALVETSVWSGGDLVLDTVRDIISPEMFALLLLISDADFYTVPTVLC